MAFGGENAGGLGNTPNTDLYNSKTDMELRIGKDILDQLLFDQGDDTAINDVCDSLRLKAYNLINTMLSGVYDVPFVAGSKSSVTTPVLINNLATDLSCYYAFQRREAENKITDGWKQIYKDAIDELLKLGSLDDSLNDAMLAYKEASMVTPTDSKIFDFNNSNNTMSWF